MIKVEVIALPLNRRLDPELVEVAERICEMRLYSAAKAARLMAKKLDITPAGEEWHHEEHDPDRFWLRYSLTFTNPADAVLFKLLWS